MVHPGGVRIVLPGSHIDMGTFIGHRCSLGRNELYGGGGGHISSSVYPVSHLLGKMAEFEWFLGEFVPKDLPKPVPDFRSGFSLTNLALFR